MYFLGVRGLTTSSYIVHDYTTSGHMDLWSIYVLYIQYIYIYIQCTYMSIQCTYISIQYISLFLMQKNVETHINSFWYGHSHWTVVVLLHKQTL
jgi:hypothetical protein